MVDLSAEQQVVVGVSARQQQLMVDVFVGQQQLMVGVSAALLLARLGQSFVPVWGLFVRVRYGKLAYYYSCLTRFLLFPFKGDSCSILFVSISAGF